MTEREKILGRVKEALRVQAPFPGTDHNGAAKDPALAPGVSGSGAAGMPAPPVRQWLPFVGKSFDDRVALFQKNATELKADFRLLQKQEELARVLSEIRDAEGWKKIGAHRGELTEFAVRTLCLPTCRTDGGYNVRELETCDAGITECDALVAQTGSVLLTSRSAGGRALSVLPPHHVVLARRDQLLADLPEAFALLQARYGANYPSFISFVTGPSRTGDIERILVLGAHGPRKLTILCF